MQGLAWSRTDTEIWFTAADVTTDRQLFGVNLSGKQRPILRTPQGARLLDVAADGRVLLSIERQQPEIAGIDPATGKERRGGSAPVALGPGAQPRFSPDGTIAAGPLLTRPPQVALNPIGTGESRRLPAGEITSLKSVAWFPDGKHLLLTGAAEGQPLRTYEMDLDGGKPQPLGPADFTGVAVASDGERVAGRNASAEAVVFDQETQKLARNGKCKKQNSSNQKYPPLELPGQADNAYEG